jgi:S-adenosylmethionine:tRNA ribosyltransferase-isomerase
MKKDPNWIHISSYNYELPPGQIAEVPLPSRDASKLLIYRQGIIEESVFKEIPTYLPPHALLVANDSRVIEARVLFQKASGGIIEIFCLEPQGDSPEEAMQKTGKVVWRCLIGGASKWKRGQVLQKRVYIGTIAIELEARYLGREGDAFAIEFSWPGGDVSFAEVLHAAGLMPLPPYIKRKSTEEDEERYQTIFARNPGSVAAPTAALHFTGEVFNALRAKNIHRHFITLHVGAGTFKPVKSETVAGHAMHAEKFHVTLETLNELQNRKEIIAVGTTSLRTLESLYWMGIKLFNRHPSPLKLDQWEAYELHASLSYFESIALIKKHLVGSKLDELYCETSLLIIPGYEFKSACALITNFHQPQSTLLLLVAAFIGEDWRYVYDYALANGFRFLSYGDSSLLWRQPLDHSVR